jgi:chemotaxis protein histidine kinase CheA
MRERTTWNRDQIRQAAMQRKADPTLMNQNHVQQQPGATDYTTGTPSSFAEDVDKTNRWEDEYKGGQVARNEIGMPEFRAETFNHPEKTAALDEETLIKKANLCVRVASLMLRKTATEAAIEDQAAALMNLPDYDLIETYTRLADEQQGQAQQDDGQDKEAGQMPPQFRENAEKKKEEAEAKKDDEKKDEGEKKEADVQQQVSLQGQQAQQQQVSQQDIQAQIQQAVAQAMQQMAQQQAQAQQCPQACGKMAQDEEKKDDQGEGQKQAEQQVQTQQVQVSQDQIAQMVQQAVQQAMQAQQQVQTQQQVPPAQQQVQTQQQVSQLGDIEINPEPVADDLGIELETPIMDTGDVALGPEDDVLMSLFANEETQAQEQIQGQGDQGQQKQASVRTASTRTVGTRPSGGVSRIGGGGVGAPKAGSDVDRMSSLWASAPDVSEAFGLTKR